MMMAMCWGNVAVACTVTNLIKKQRARYRLLLNSKASYYLLDLTNMACFYWCEFVPDKEIGCLRYSQAFDSHAQLLRLAQQIDQHKGTRFAIVDDVFAF
jgi:hypothetical protein